jgi:hypothetical protein
MILTLSPQDFDKNCLQFGEKSKNNIIENSSFYNIHYANELINIYNIFINYSLQDCSIDKYYNKYKITFPFNNNEHFVMHLSNVEKEILDMFKSDKTPKYKLFNQLARGCFKCSSIKNYSDDNSNFNMDGNTNKNTIIKSCSNNKSPGKQITIYNNGKIHQKSTTQQKINILIKISGIWEDDNSYGIIYKFNEG